MEDGSHLRREKGDGETEAINAESGSGAEGQELLAKLKEIAEYITNVSRTFWPISALTIK